MISYLTDEFAYSAVRSFQLNFYEAGGAVEPQLEMKMKLELMLKLKQAREVKPQHGIGFWRA